MGPNASGQGFYARSFIVFLTLLAGVFTARGADTYGPAPSELQIPELHIGRATFTDVVLTFNAIIAGPGGSTPGPLTAATEDTYDWTTGQLTIPAVNVYNTAYLNTKVSVSQLKSIGTVSGADTFDGKNLTIPYLAAISQLPNGSYGPATYYHNVVLPVSVADVVSIGGGMPTDAFDKYDGTTNLLTIGAVQVGSTVFTNVTVRPTSGAKLGSVAERQVHGFGSGTDGRTPNFLITA